MRNFYIKYEKRIGSAGAFLLPFLFCLFVCIRNEVYPFGDRCILHVDMYHQYCPFFLELLDKLKSGGSLMYSWTAGVGSDFLALYTYYLASPLNWLIILCPRGLVIEFMTILVLVKIGLAGFAFYQFLQYRSGTALFRQTGAAQASDEEKGEASAASFSVGQRTFFTGLKVPAGLVFATAYAMSGFVAAYSWDIMWMDCVALMPLVAMGLLKMMREKKPALYYIMLALCIISNYYLAIMICIFLCFYFVLLYVEEKGGLADLGRFAFYSLLAGGTAAFLLIPEYKILGFSGSSGFEKPEFSWYFGIFEEMSRLSVTAEPYTANDHWPNLYVGAFTLILVVVYLCIREIPWKKKLPRFLMIVFLVLSFSNSWLDFFWHGLHFPDSLPGRESFLFAFVMLAVAFETLQQIDVLRIWYAAAAIVVWMILLGGAFYLNNEEITDPMAIVVTGILTICYGMFVVMITLGKERERRNLSLLACLLAVCELVLNMAVTGFSTTGRTSYLEHMDAYRELIQDAREAGGEGFFRIEDTQRKTKNDSALYDYRSVTQFSSLMNINVSHFYQRMLMEGGKNFYCYNGATPLLSAMLSVKYQISDCADEEGPLMSLVSECDGQYLYENNYCLPLGYMVPEDFEDAWDVNRDKIENINDMGYRAGALGDILTELPVECEENEGSTVFTAQTEGYHYVVSQGNSADSLTVTNTSGFSKKYGKTTHKYLIGLGYMHPGDTATISNSNSETISFTPYWLNMDAVKAAYANLSAQTMELESFTDTRVRGKIEVTTPGRLVLTIPNEGGWTLYVDGERTTAADFAETFVSVSLDKGSHEIELRYLTPGLVQGSALSIGCVVLFVLAMFWRCRQKM